MIETNNAGKATRDVILPPQIIIDFILNLARHVQDKGISDGGAILIARDIITELGKRHGGTAVYFAKRESSAEKIELQTVLRISLQKHGIPANEAGEIALNVMDKFFASFGGDQLYIPTSGIRGRQAIASRNMAIIAAYRKEPDGECIKRLKVEHDLTQRQIYNILGNQVRVLSMGKASQGIKKAAMERKERMAERNAGIVAAYKENPEAATIKKLADTHKLKVHSVNLILRQGGFREVEK